MTGLAFSYSIGNFKGNLGLQKRGASIWEGMSSMHKRSTKRVTLLQSFVLVSQYVRPGGADVRRPDCLDIRKTGSYLLTVEAVSFRGSETVVDLRAQDGTLWKKTCTHPVSCRPGDVLQAELTAARPVLFQ